MSAPILIVEDEPKLAALLQDYIRQAQFETHWIDNGKDVVDWAREREPRLILLDLMLPGRNGLDVCRDIRSFSDVPIIMLTARVEEVDRLVGLQLGADDYICKPFSPREVVARIKAILRRVENPAVRSDKAISYRSVRLDESRFRCSVNDAELELTRVEFRLLAAMMKRPGHVFGREQLMTLVYQDGRVVSDRTIDSHVKNLRRKLNQASAEGDLIHSVYGVGYKLE